MNRPCVIHGLGDATSTLITTGISTASKIGGSAAVAAAGGAATAAGAALSVAIPVAGAIVGALIAGLLSAHYAREKGARSENSMLNSIMPAVIKDIQSVFAALNAGTISPSDAQTVLDQIETNFWQAVAPYERNPGQAGNQSKCLAMTCTGGAPVPSCLPMTDCNRGCTASCCVGCNSIQPWILVANHLIETGGGTYTIPAGGPSKYGFSGTPAFSITYKPPKNPSYLNTAAGAVSTAANAIESVAGGGLMPLIVLAIGAFLIGRIL